MARPRREITDELDARVPGFERCGRPSIDAWMDIYRAANRRMPLSRLLVVLSIPAATWAEPPHQDYVRGVFNSLSAAYSLASSAGRSFKCGPPQACWT